MLKNNLQPLNKIAIIKVNPINFTIRDEAEQQSITHGFQKFLNSLDFPVQIVIGTDYLNLDKYTKELELRVEKLVAKRTQQIQTAKNY